jgi:hypothetical protein
MATNVKVDTLSDLSSIDAELLVGRTVSQVQAGEYNIVLVFEDGSKLEVSGSSYGDCALGVEFTGREPSQNK